MTRLLAALAVLLAACSAGPTSPVPSPAPPAEIAVLQSGNGAYSIVEVRTGSRLAALPAGILALGLSGGQDIAEGYLVTPSAAGGSAVEGLVPSRSFALDPLATQSGEAVSAVLAGAPGLTTFSGRQTVLVILGKDGRLAGYQHGSRLWANPGGEGQALVQTGSQVLVGSARGWQAIALENGSLGPVLSPGPCEPGPLAALGGTTWLDCAGTLVPGGQKVPGSRPAVFGSGAAQTLNFPDGQLWRLAGSTATRIGQGVAWSVPPVASPDGSVLYVATPSGVERVDAGSGGHRSLLRAPAIASLALSRDGNYLYAIEGSRLLTYTTGSGAEAGSVPAAGQLIRQVAGG
jgi:hypothetical protein